VRSGSRTPCFRFSVFGKRIEKPCFLIENQLPVTGSDVVVLLLDIEHHHRTAIGQQIRDDDPDPFP